MIQSTLIVVIGLVFFSSMLGLGGALLYIPVFKWLGYDFKSVAIPTGLFLNGLTALSASVYYPTKQAAATSAFIVIFSSFSGFAGHAAEGHYHWPLLLGSAVAVIVASQLGAKVMHEKMKARWIKQMFGVVPIGVAIKLAWPILL